MPHYHRGQQYSIIAMTDENGNVTERYAYDAHGVPTVFDGYGVELPGGSTENNRYMYTGKEWDGDLALYHFGGRMYDPYSGRFISRDPSGYSDGYSLYRAYFGLQDLDPTGRAVVTAPFEPRDGGGPWPDLPNDFPINIDGPTVDDIDIPLTPDEVIDDLKDNFEGFPRCDQCTAVELDSIMTKIRSAVAKASSSGLRDRCQSWCDSFKKALNDAGGLSNKCVFSNDCKYAFDVGGFIGGHVVFRIVLCNGAIIYADNGIVGGDDNIGIPGDIPPVIWTPLPIPITGPTDTDDREDIPQVPLPNHLKF